MNLFAYGTLMCTEIMQQVAGCLPAQLPATLAGYRRCRLRGEEYPAIVGQQVAVVQGVVYLEVPQEAWRRLDRFEGEMYDRRPVLVDGAGGKSLAADSLRHQGRICPSAAAGGVELRGISPHRQEEICRGLCRFCRTGGGKGGRSVKRSRPLAKAAAHVADRHLHIITHVHQSRF